MMTNAVSRVVTNQKPPVEHLQPVVVICDVTDHDVLAAVAYYLQTAGLMGPEVDVQVMAPAVFEHPRVQRLLADDQQAGRVSFVVIRDSACRHYYKNPEQAGFSLHLTAL